MGDAAAYFNDSDISENNVYTAGTLDFSLSSRQDDFEPLIFAKNMKPGDTIARNIYIKREGDSAIRYKASSEFAAGNCDEDLYDSLKLEIWYKYYTEAPSSDYNENLAKILRYSGSLKDFDDFGTNPKDPDLQMPNDHPYFANDFYGEDEHWLTFLVSLPEDIPQDILENLENKSCEFKFVFNGWQSGSGLEQGNGFTDEEEIRSEVASRGLRINEVYYYSNQGDYENEGNGQWIEIYNQTNAPIDIERWIIEDDMGGQKSIVIENSFCDSSSCVIPAQGYAVIAEKDKTWEDWQVPPAAVRITLGKKIGNGLKNEGDRVILKRPDGMEVDAMSYGDDETIFELDGAPEGHSLGRSPDGYDTDKASDWRDQGGHSPSPGWSNWIRVEIPNGGEVWYMVPESYGSNWCEKYGAKYGMNENCEYSIEWKTNLPEEEGDNSDFTADIWFCKESGENCFYQIAENTENDGIYHWRIPFDDRFIGDDDRINIKIGKAGEEKSAQDMTDMDFCPLVPPYYQPSGGNISEPPVEEAEDGEIGEDPSEELSANGAASYEDEIEGEGGGIEEENVEESGIEKESGIVGGETEEIKKRDSDIIEGEKNKDMNLAGGNDAYNSASDSESGDINNEEKNKDEDENTDEDKDKGTDIKDEEYVLLPKEKGLPDGNDSDGGDDGDSGNDEGDYISNNNDEDKSNDDTGNNPDGSGTCDDGGSENVNSGLGGDNADSVNENSLNNKLVDCVQAPNGD